MILLVHQEVLNEVLEQGSQENEVNLALVVDSVGTQQIAEGLDFLSVCDQDCEGVLLVLAQIAFLFIIKLRFSWGRTSWRTIGSTCRFPSRRI